MIFIKKILNYLLNFLFFLKILNFPKKSLRVLMFHDIENKKNFINQIKYLKKKWKFVTPNLFYQICLGKKKINGRYLLLTFDDGFKSNIHVAEKILKKLNIKAIFFIPLKFLLIKSKKNKIDFLKANLKIKNIYKNMNNMDINDLKKLINLKHSIGAHTFSHINLKKINNNKKLKFEIIESANKLEKKLNIKVNYFAFNFGRLAHISPKIIHFAKKRFKVIFTGIRGKNFHKRRLIFRDNISPEDNNFDLNAYLSGYLDFIYSKERDILDSQYKKINN